MFGRKKRRLAEIAASVAELAERDRAELDRKRAEATEIVRDKAGQEIARLQGPYGKTFGKPPEDKPQGKKG